MLDVIAKAGGLFAALAFIHFLVDWVFQSHDEAMRKSKEDHIRARHCIIYMVGFFPLLMPLFYANGSLGAVKFLLAAMILFWSHFYEDTYAPVVWWFMKIRKPPELKQMVELYGLEKGFVTYLTTNGPLPYILLIAIDQIVHLTFLWPVVALVMWK